MSDKTSILSRVKEYIERLSFRERIILLFGAVFVISSILYLSLSSSPSSKPAPQSQMSQLQKSQKDFAQILKKYLAIKSLVDQIDSRLEQTPEDFDLYKKVNELIQKIGIREKVVKMDPGESSGNDYLKEEYVDLSFQRIDLESLVEFLKRLEGQPGLVRISQLSIKRRLDRSKTLDVVMRVSAYLRKQEGQ